MCSHDMILVTGFTRDEAVDLILYHLIPLETFSAGDLSLALARKYLWTLLHISAKGTQVIALKGLRPEKLLYAKDVEATAGRRAIKLRHSLKLTCEMRCGDVIGMTSSTHEELGNIWETVPIERVSHNSVLRTVWHYLPVRTASLIRGWSSRKLFNTYVSTIWCWRVLLCSLDAEGIHLR